MLTGQKERYQLLRVQNICIDIDHGFVRSCAILLPLSTTARCFHFRWIQKYEHDYVLADSAYAGECFEDHPSLGGFESLNF